MYNEYLTLCEMPMNGIGASHGRGKNGRQSLVSPITQQHNAYH